MNTEENKELKEKIINKIKEKTDLVRYPFDEFWFGVGFEEATKQAEKRFIEKVSSISLEDFDKFIDKLKSELNCSLPSNFDCDETALKVVDNLASELKQKLTNHTPLQVTENRNSVLPRLANGSQQTAKGYPKEKIKSIGNGK